MRRTWTLTASLAAVTLASTAALAFGPIATAEPGGPPMDPGQLPGMNAMTMLGPAVQQAAMSPGSAPQLLVAAASALAGNAATPADSVALADAVAHFVQNPAAASVPSPQGLPAAPPEHIPAPGAIPGTEAHLPMGVDPANALGPAPEALPAPAPAPAAAPASVAAPAPAPVALSAAAPAAAPTPAPDALPAPAPLPDAPAPAPEAAPVPAPDANVAPAPGPGEFAPDSPPTQEFMYPSISNNCLLDGGNVIATALSVAGPAKIPSPGPGPGQTAYVFTAVGTPAPAAEQRLPLNVTWVNLTSGKSGSATLKPNPDINPAGPTTLVAIVDTGSGSIMSTIFGQVTTVDKQCTFMPTIGSTVVP